MVQEQRHDVSAHHRIRVQKQNAIVLRHIEEVQLEKTINIPDVPDCVLVNGVWRHDPRDSEQCPPSRP